MKLKKYQYLLIALAILLAIFLIILFVTRRNQTDSNALPTQDENTVTIPGQAPGSETPQDDAFVLGENLNGELTYTSKLRTGNVTVTFPAGWKPEIDVVSGGTYDVTLRSDDLIIYYDVSIDSGENLSKLAANRLANYDPSKLTEIELVEEFSKCNQLFRTTDKQKYIAVKCVNTDREDTTYAYLMTMNYARTKQRFLDILISIE